jgi:EAL domain-containing protein (putative c-di-GMP-specific phosphodiesterase class I)
MAENHREPEVLLVDDDEDIRRIYTKALRKLGFATETAADGREAAALLKRKSYDVIVSDLSMPNMGGLEFLRKVRQQDLDVPVVLMTGQPGLETAAEAVEYGAFRYLLKPVDLDRLGDVVQEAANMHQMAKLKREALQLVGSEGRQLGDRASLVARFDNALELLWMAYQPIVRWPERSVFAYEALVRSSEPSLMTPLDLLDAADRLGRLRDLGRRARALVAVSLPEAPQDALLFVNLHAADLNDPELSSPASPLAAIASRVVLEITERASLDEVRDVSAKINKLRHLGFRIAVDDLGAGYAGLATFSQLDPEFAKLDISLIRGVDMSSKKRSVVRAMTRLCTQELAVQVVSEGVETVGERDALEVEGCSLLQGYLFAKPAAGFPAPQW